LHCRIAVRLQSVATTNRVLIRQSAALVKRCLIAELAAGAIEVALLRAQSGGSLLFDRQLLFGGRSPVEIALNP
jgi:hypothetical protein